MQFRLSHILAMMIFVAFFSYMIRFGGGFGWTVVVFITWMVCGLLIIRAIVRPGRERLITLSGLLLGLSYLIAPRYVLAGQLLPTSLFLHHMISDVFDVGDPRLRSASTQQAIFDAVGTAEIGLAYLFGFLGAGAAAYWTRGDASNKPAEWHS